MRDKAIHIILAVLFLLFAAVQFNDPDPLVWILIYGSVSLVAFIKLFLNQLNLNPLIITLVVILSLYALFYIPLFIEFLSKPGKADLISEMKVTKPWIEGTRELLGLLIAIGALLYLRTRRIKQK